MASLLMAVEDRDEELGAAYSAVARILESVWNGSRCARRRAMVADAMAPAWVTRAVLKRPVWECPDATMGVIACAAYYVVRATLRDHMPINGPFVERLSRQVAVQAFAPPSSGFVVSAAERLHQAIGCIPGPSPLVRCERMEPRESEGRGSIRGQTQNNRRTDTP